MIIEGLLTCADESGPHVSAIGPVVSEDMKNWTLRPFQTSQMFSLLRQSNRCVFHVMDDVLPIVQLVLSQSPSVSTTERKPDTWIIDNACQWFELEITTWRLDTLRSEADARVVDQGSLRPFWGWNRAKHALLEAAILISRESILPREEIELQIERLRSPIEKTSGPREQAAWELVEQWLQG